ncbi:MAG: DUF2087 domain-containing protein [Caldilineaceae bacterium]
MTRTSEQREGVERPDEESLAPYVREGRLLSYPRKWERRLMILQWLAASFEPGRDYSEAEVNRVLSGHELDHVTLRRYLVDAELLARAGGHYWRPSAAGAVPGDLD